MATSRLLEVRTKSQERKLWGSLTSRPQLLGSKIGITITAVMLVITVIISITWHVTASDFSLQPQKPDSLFPPDRTGEGNDSPEQASGFPKVTQLISEAELGSNLGLRMPSPVIFFTAPPNVKVMQR